MKTSHLLLAATGLACAWYAATTLHGTPSLPVQMPAQTQGEILYYQSPMHPWVKSAVPGKCTVCGMDLVPVYRGGASRGEMGGDTVALSSESIRVTGVQTAPVQRAPLVRTLRISGKFEEDASSHSVISAPVEGRIDGLGLVHGNGKLTQREPLATIYSQTLLRAAKRYKDALGHDEAAAADARRELEHCGLVWEQIKAIPFRQENDIYFGILSPRTGIVVKSYVSEGQYVLEGDRLFEITDPTRLWFMFPAYERDLTVLQVGQIVEIDTPGLAGEKLKAPIASIERELDPVTHSAHVRLEIVDRTGRIRRGASGTGVVNLPTPEVLTVPRAAVIWPSGAPRVYVETQDGVFEPRTVQLGRAGDAGWEVLGGLNEGDRAVTAGNMLIDGQAQINSMAATTSR